MKTNTNQPENRLLSFTRIFHKFAMMIALIDCNNFFVSCELTVNPELIGRPVIVGGNGDNGGCAVAMSNEAKALGIPRGVPIFKIRHLIERHNIVVLPSRHELYSRKSAEVMNFLRSLNLDSEVYSVDEAFIQIPFSGNEAIEFCQYVRGQIKEISGIPVSIGIASTKTLAKVATDFAKHYKGYNGVCIMDTPDKVKRALALTAIGDVWGIGRKLKVKFDNIGIRTAAEFAALPLEVIERNFNSSVATTWRELNGEYMLDKESHQRKYQSCTHSRTFDHDIHDVNEIKRQIAYYAQSVAWSLRKHRRLAKEIEVRLHTNPYHTTAPQYNGAAKVKLTTPTNDTLAITAAAESAFDATYRKGYAYKKGGVTATSTIGESELIPTLFDHPAEDEHRRALNATMDRLNEQGLKVSLASTT